MAVARHCLPGNAAIGTAGEDAQSRVAILPPMAEHDGPVIWGLWNDRLRDWFNPGTRKAYFPTREAALRALPFAVRQYSMGKWEVRPFVFDDVGRMEGPAGDDAWQYAT